MVASQLTETEARQRSAQLTVHSYDVTLDLTDGEGQPAETTFRSRTVVAFSAEGGETFVDVQPVSLDSVVLNGIALDPTMRDGRLALPGLAADNVLVVDGVFALANEQQGLERTVDPADGEVYFASLMLMAAAQRVFACFDQPDLKAPSTFHITAPGEWEVISNGSVTTAESADGGAVTRHFTPTAPIPAYMTAVLAGPYHRVTDTAEGPDGPMFGYPCPFGKYDQIFGADAGIGGIANRAADEICRRVCDVY